MTARPLAVSLVAFDGHALEPSLAAVADAGAGHVEPAFIDGATDFSDDELSEAAGRALAARIALAGLGCAAVSAHMDCGADDAAARLIRRLRFARARGARFVITNSARADRRDAFMRALDQALPVAESCGVRIAFENPGYGPADLIRAGVDAAGLLDAIGSPWVGFNYDSGNVLTCSEGAVRPEDEATAALPRASHVHLKDVALLDGLWRYGAVGEGSVGYDAILARVGGDVPIGVELPLRLVRRSGEGPVRGAVVAFEQIVAAVTRSLGFVRDRLQVSEAAG